jgi:hypothetical protein
MAVTTSGWSPRHYRPEDDEQILKLLQVCFDGWPSVETNVQPLEHLRWKLASPLSSWRQDVVCERDDRIVGCRLYILREAWTGDRPLVWKIGMETAVHPDYRNRGAAGAMQGVGDERFSEVDAHLLFSSHPALLEIRKQLVILPLRAVRVLRRRAEGPRPAGTDRSGSWQVRPLASFDDRVDRLWTAAREEFAFLLDRRSEFMNWRYNDARAGAFATLAAVDDGALLGYVVTRCSRGIGHIADVLALPGRLDVVRSLLAEAVCSLQAAGVGSIECWCAKRHPYEPVMTDLGFVQKKRSVRLTFRPQRGPEASFVRIRDSHSAVHMMAGDTDLV